MRDRELYQQKLQAQLDAWRADVSKLKAKASAASADVQLEMNKQIRTLESRLEEGKAKLAELGAAGEDAWESVKDGVESSWGTIKSAFSDAISKFRS